MIEKKRYLEFDIARTLTLILMPFAHLAESCKNLELVTDDVYINNSWSLEVASFGVLVFMMMLGVNILITSHNTPKDLCKRAFKTFLLGLALNVVRYIIPGILALIIRNDISYFKLGLLYSIASDILYFAALCFLFFALIKKLKISSLGVLIIGIIFSLVSSLLSSIEISNEILKAFLGNFIYIDETSAFSLDSWIVMVCFGYAFGDLYISMDKKGKLNSLNLWFMGLSPVAAGICLLVCYILKTDIRLHIGSEFLEYRLTLLGIVFLTSIFLFFEGIVYFISQKIKNEKLINFFTCFSKGITIYYFIQWSLVIWILLIFGVFGFGEDGLYIGNILYNLIGIAVIILSYFISMLIIKPKKKNEQV